MRPDIRYTPHFRGDRIADTFETGKRVVLVVNKELRILILEDNASDVVLINRELRQSGLAFRSIRVETREGFIRELEEDPPDLIFSDHGLPTFHGFSALAYVGGTAKDADGNTYTMQTDMRVFSGTYVSADGSVLQGTFAFI